MSELKNSQVVSQVYEDFFVQKRTNEELKRLLDVKSRELGMWKEKCIDLEKRNQVLQESHLKRFDLMENEFVLVRENEKKKTEEILFLRSENKKLRAAIEKRNEEIQALKKVVEMLSQDQKGSNEKMELMAKQISRLVETVFEEKKTKYI